MNAKQGQNPKRRSAATIVQRLGDEASDDRLALEQLRWELGDDAVLELIRDIRLADRRMWFRVLLGGLFVIPAINFVALGNVILGVPLMLASMALIGTGLEKVNLKFRLVKVLAGFNDIRAINPLLEAYSVISAHDDATKRAVRAIMPPLLTNLRTSDTHVLSEDARNVLHREFQRNDEELVLAALKAFEQVGNGYDLPYVRALANGEGLAARNRRVQDAAYECLPFLYERIHQEQASHGLLRPASAGEIATNTLLRPAYSANAATPHQLLRPTSQDNYEP